MRTYRENPDGEANQRLTRDNDLAVVMAKMATAKDLLEQREIILQAQWLVRQRQLDVIQEEQEQRWTKEIVRKANP